MHRELEKGQKNLVQAISHNPDLESLLVQLREVEGKLKVLRAEEMRVRGRMDTMGEYRSPADIEVRFEEAVAGMAAGSRNFAEVLRRLIPKFVIHPIQALNCPQVRPRAVMTLSTAAWTSADSSAEEVITIDPFDLPNQIKFMPDVERAMAEHPEASVRVIQRNTGINYMTVKRARDYPAEKPGQLRHSFSGRNSSRRDLLEDRRVLNFLVAGQ